MKTLAVIGAGPALGLSMARRFGREGYQVGLVARNAARLDGFVAQLKGDGVKAAAFAADVMDRPGLEAALDRLQSELGPVDVLEYSPTPLGAALSGPETLTVEAVTHQINYTLLGGVAAVGKVLPGMIERGDGALLFTGGLSAKIPVPSHASAGLALAAQRNYAFVLNRALGPKGVYAGTITVAGIIQRSASEDMVKARGMAEAMKAFFVDPDQMAEVYWDMAAKRDRVEEVVGNPEGVAASWK